MRLVLGVLAALVFAFAGYQMINLKSQSGNTVAELFDNYVGIFSFGMALLSLAVAVPSAPGAGRAVRSSTSSPATDGALVTASAASQNGPARLTPVAGWDPNGDRICPSCVRRVDANRTTHCNHCGAQLVSNA